MTKENKKVVVIGGGTGTYTVLSALKNYDVDLSAVVSMCDDGGSTGRLRDEYGILPPGDVLRSLVALSGEDNFKLRELFGYRFEDGSLQGHTMGNIFLAGAEKRFGSFEKAILATSSVLNTEGEVHPVTWDNVRLCAIVEGGDTVEGETNIDIPQKRNKKLKGLKVEKIFIKPKARANQNAIRAIKGADAIIVGPGDLYTSILPNFLVEGVSAAVKSSKAKKIYVCNLMTKHGETDGFMVSDFVGEIENYIGKKNIFDNVLVNFKKPHYQRLKKYFREEKAEFIKLPEDFQYLGLVQKDLLSEQEGLIRHDKKKLGVALIEIIND